MSNLISSDIVAQQVIAALHLKITSSKLLSHLKVVTLPSTGVLEASYDDTDAARGRRSSPGGGVFTQLVGPAPQRAAAEPAGRYGAFRNGVRSRPHASRPRQADPGAEPGVAGLVGMALGLITVLLLSRQGTACTPSTRRERLGGQSPIAMLSGRHLGHEGVQEGAGEDPQGPGAPQYRSGSGVRLTSGAQTMQAVLRWSPQFRGIRPSS